MKLVVWTVLLLWIFGVLIPAEKTRVKRFVGIRKNSKFFLRMGLKDSIFANLTFFAHSAGFKVTWEIPEGTEFSEFSKFSKKRPIRALYDNAEFLFDRHGFDGKSCLLHNICQATEYVSERTGVVAKILRLLLRYSNQDNDTSVLDILNCDDYRNMCPLNFAGMNVYLE